MAWMVCECGETLSTVAAPNDIQLRVYTDHEWDQMINMDIKDALDIPFPKVEVWRCPECERIYVFEGNKVVKTYILEKKNDHG